MVEQTGRTPPELIPPQVDEAALYLLELYTEIRGTASPLFSGQVLVRVKTILEYQLAYNIQLEPWEVDVMIALDDVYLEVMA